MELLNNRYVCLEKPDLNSSDRYYIVWDSQLDQPVLDEDDEYICTKIARITVTGSGFSFAGLTDEIDRVKNKCAEINRIWFEENNYDNNINDYVID